MDVAVILMELETKCGRGGPQHLLTSNVKFSTTEKSHPKAFELLYAAGINKANEIHERWDDEIILRVIPKILLDLY